MKEHVDFESINKEKFIYLTTKGRNTGKEYTKELWFAQSSNGKIYLSHEGERTDWMKNLMKNPRVRARIGSLNFEADAKIAKGDSREDGKKSLYEKYYGEAGREKIDDWFELSMVVELAPI